METEIEQLKNVNRFLAGEQAVLRTLLFDLIRRTPDFDGLLESVLNGTSYHAMRAALASEDPNTKATFDQIIEAYTGMIKSLAAERKRADG